MRICKDLLSILIDFLFLIAIFGTIALGILFSKNVLFAKDKQLGSFTFITEELPLSMKDDIQIGDSLYDTLTKRKIGRIENLTLIESENSVQFILSTSEAICPRGSSLRTRDVWFYIRETL